MQSTASHQGPISQGVPAVVYYFRITAAIDRWSDMTSVVHDVAGFGLVYEKKITTNELERVNRWMGPS